MSIIEVKSINLTIGKNNILKHINVSFEEGKIHGLIGRNGSGKTMLMKCICGFIKPTSGEIIVDGKKVGKDVDFPKDMGIIIETPGFIPYYSGYKNLKLLAGLNNKIGKDEIRNSMKQVGLDPDLKRHVRKYSLGMRQRLGLAQAIMENPKILILDEPTVGLDPNQIIEIRSLIKKLGKRHTVILSSHILPEIQAVCDRIIIINKGEVAADGTANDIAKNITNEHKMTLRIEGPTHTAADKAEIAAALRKVTGVSYVRADMEREKGIYDYDIETDGKTDVRRDINKLCAENDWNILMLQLSDLTLEDIFLKITMGEENSIAAKDPSKKKSSPKLDLKIEDGELRASEVTDEAPEEAEKPAETDLKNEGGEE